MERLGLANLTVNPFTKSASITLVQIDDDGNQISGGATITQPVSGAAYDSSIAALETSVIDYLVTLLVSGGILAPGTTIEDT